MLTIICPYCGQNHSQTARFCPVSGKPIPVAAQPPAYQPVVAAAPAQGSQANPYINTVQQSYGVLPGMTGMLPSNAYLHNRYIIQQKIGQGGMAAVYRAVDTRTGAMLAIKEMSDSASSATPEDRAYGLQIFEQEARLLATLSHPNLPRVSDYFAENNKHYLAMEFVEGDTLQRILERRGHAFLEAEVIPYAIQLCDVLSYLHNQHPPIIFRDLKPANIMVTPAGQIKLIDFGIARFFKAGQAKDTQSLGTLGYVAPEVMRHQQSESRSDIYALCVTLLQLLTGIDPGDYLGTTLPSARELNQSVSPEMDRILKCGLQHDKNLRFHNAAEMRAQLCSLTVSQQGGTNQTPVVKRSSRPTTRLLMAAVQVSPRQLAGVLALVVLAIVGASWQLAPILRAMPINWNFFPIFAVFGSLGFAAYPKRGMAILSHFILTSALVMTISLRLGMWFTYEQALLALLTSGIFMEAWLLFLPFVKGKGGQEAWRQEVAWFAVMGAPAVWLFFQLLSRGTIGQDLISWIFGALFSALGWFIGDLINQWLLYRQTGFRRTP